MNLPKNGYNMARIMLAESDVCVPVCSYSESNIKFTVRCAENGVYQTYLFRLMFQIGLLLKDVLSFYSLFPHCQPEYRTVDLTYMHLQCCWQKLTEKNVISIHEEKLLCYQRCLYNGENFEVFQLTQRKRLTIFHYCAQIRYSKTLSAMVNWNEIECRRYKHITIGNMPRTCNIMQLQTPYTILKEEIANAFEIKNTFGSCAMFRLTWTFLSWRVWSCK